MEEKIEYESDLPTLPNVDQLRTEPVEIECPACGLTAMTRVENQAVTKMQIFVKIVNFCLCCEPIRWSGRYDNNHYCSKCGCFIGRFIRLSWYKKHMIKLHRKDVEAESRWQRIRRVEKEQLDKNKKDKLIVKSENKT